MDGGDGGFEPKSDCAERLRGRAAIVKEAKGPAIKYFAWFAVTLMVLVAFQVCSSPASAADAPALEAGLTDSDDQNANETVEQFPVYTVGNAPVIPEPFYGDSPGGGFQSFDSSLNRYVSSLGAPLRYSTLVEDNESLKFVTAYGNYTFDKNSPSIISYSDIEGMILSPESYFGLSYQGSAALPSGGWVVTKSDDSIVVHYNLTNEDLESRKIGTMELYVDFAAARVPKMTVTVLEVDPSLQDWQVFWKVAPQTSLQYLQLDSSFNHCPVSAYVGRTVPVQNLSVGLTDSSSSTKLEMDWSDAGEGSLSVQSTSVYSQGALQVLFAKGKTIVDPKLVSLSTASEGISITCQRKTFSYAGYYWAFYSRGNAISYNWSADGLAWMTGSDLPGSQATCPGVGFDVAQRGNHLIVSWFQNDAEHSLNAAIGTITKNSIRWNAPTQHLSDGSLPGSPGAAIGSDGAYWVAAQIGRFQGNNSPYIEVFRSFDGASFSVTMQRTTFDSATKTWPVLLPLPAGKMWLLETWNGASGGPDDDVKAGVSYFDGYTWGSRFVQSPGALTSAQLYSGDKSDAFSAVVGPDGAIHLAYKSDDGQYLGYSRFGPLYYNPSTWAWVPNDLDIDTVPVSSPSISLSADQHLNIFYVVDGQSVYQVEKPAESLSQSWSSPYRAFVSQSGSITYLTSWSSPAQYCVVLWQEPSTPVRIYSATLPLPIGSAGMGGNPWNREGFSPYEKYFSELGQSVSPGTGLLTFRENLFSVPCRNGIDLGVSIIYEEPRYFSKLVGSPYTSYAFPYCDLSQGWSLDLPWLDSSTITLPGGQRFLIQWGNTGDPTVFENHAGTHFTLRQWIGAHSTLRYELVTGAGLRYRFADDFTLRSIGDLRSLVPGGPIGNNDGLSSISFYYTGSQLISITEDQGQGRRVTLNYSGGMLSEVVTPDNTKFRFYYALKGGKMTLVSYKDPVNRAEYFDYMVDEATQSLVLNKTVFPTGSKVVYAFDKSMPNGADVFSWLVKSQAVRDNATNALIRQADYYYNAVAGSIVFANVTEKNETAKVQRSTEHVFRSQNTYMSETVKDAAGVQLARKDIWFDQAGQPVRIDTYNGSSPTISYSEYSSYDDWGNLIFTKNALGNEAYFSYTNSKSNNSFQGGGLLKKSSSGRIFDDSFDDWNISDWSKELSAGNTAMLDVSMDPESAPAVKLTRTGPGSASVTRDIGDQTSDFIFQTKFMVADQRRNYILGLGDDGSIRLYTWAESGHFYWYDGVPHPLSAECVSNIWYDVGYWVHPSSNKYDIYIDGKVAYRNANLGAGGVLNKVRFQAFYDSSMLTSQWFDTVRIYKNSTVTVSLPSGYLAELYDSNGTLLNRSKSGCLNLPQLTTTAPPASMKIVKVGHSSFSTPVMDIWGGDVYTVSTGTYATYMDKIGSGFGARSQDIADEGWPAGSSNYTTGGGEGAWASDAMTGAYAVSGSNYHISEFAAGSHYHGFKDSSSWISVYKTNVLIQYIWLETIPQEIMLQFQFADGSWHRVYWGGDGSGNDIITSPQHPWLTPVNLQRFRVGDMPMMTGQWLQLTVHASNLSPFDYVDVKGVFYGLYGGAAKWDLTSLYSSGLYVFGLSSGWEVELTLDNGRSVNATQLSNPAILDLYSIAHVLPTSGRLRVYNSSKLLYESPWIQEIYSLDRYTYSTPEFYCSLIRSDMHNALVGSLTYQDSGKTVQEKIYILRDYEGDALETKTRLGSSWVHTQAGYDRFGNMIWSTDASGRRTITDFSSSDGYTYPLSMRQGGLTDTYDFATSWHSVKSAGGGDTSWLAAAYSSAGFFTPPSSLGLSFSYSGGGEGNDWGIARMWNRYEVGAVQALSLRMLVQTYQHDGGGDDSLDSGIKMRLFDSSGVNYANYTYWLVVWQGNSASRQNFDPSVNNLGNNQIVGSWLNISMHPASDWSIDWARCANMTFEIYENTSGAAGDSFSVFYDDFSVDDFAANSTTSLSYDRDGNVLTIRDPLGRWTNHTYDAIGREIKVTSPEGAFRNWSYYDSRNLVVTWDELRHKSTSWYDKVGRPVKAERYGFAASNYSYETRTYNWLDQVLSYRDAMGRFTSYSYDSLGRQISITYPGGSYSTVSYDDLNRRVATMDELGHKTVKIFDNLGQLNATREYYSTTGFYETKMAYDAVGNLLTVRTSNGQVTRITYDTLNRVTRTTYDDGFCDQATYDDAGRMITATDRASSMKSLRYDSAGNLVKLSSASDTILNSYDCAGQRVRTSNSLGSITYTYDKCGRVKYLNETVVATYSLLFSYDAIGNVKSIRYPDLKIVTLDYDAYGRLKFGNRTTNSSLTLLQTAYNKDDSIATETFGNSMLVTSYSYNLRGWPTMLWTNKSGSTKLSLSYSYYLDGNVRYLVTNDGSTARNEGYAFDQQERLTRGWTNASGSWGKITYGYDSVGNRLWKNEAGTNTTYLYGPYNQLNKTTAGSTIWWYNYDRNGNLIWKNGTTKRYQYVFNSLNQLTQAINWTKSGQSWSSTVAATYYYDANCARAKVIVGSTTTEYLYLGHDPLFERTGTVKTDYVYLNGKLKAKLTGTSSDAYYYLSDSIGSVWQVWKDSASSAAFKVKTYKPFGTPVSSSLNEKVRFAGEIQDNPTGLYYIGARWYDPELGRFVSMDSNRGDLSSPQRMNRYVYCMDNPLTVTDPTGERGHGTPHRGLHGFKRPGGISSGGSSTSGLDASSETTYPIRLPGRWLSPISGDTPIGDGTGPIPPMAIGIGVGAVYSYRYEIADAVDAYFKSEYGRDTHCHEAVQKFDEIIADYQEWGRNELDYAYDFLCNLYYAFIDISKQTMTTELQIVEQIMTTELRIGIETANSAVEWFQKELPIIGGPISPYW